MTKYNEVHLDCLEADKKLRVQHISGPKTKSRMSSTVKVGATGVSPGHRGDSQKSQRQNENQLLHEGELVRILGNISTEGFGEGTLRT